MRLHGKLCEIEFGIQEGWNETPELHGFMASKFVRPPARGCGDALDDTQREEDSDCVGRIPAHTLLPMNRDPQGDRACLTAIARKAMIDRKLEPDFSPAARQEVAGIRGPATAAGSVRDLRGLLWASIDNDDSRDLDQLTVAEPLAGGRVRILVAVADVDALVAKGSALDSHAAHNTTSVYTPAVIFPMLPETLSTNLT